MTINDLIEIARPFVKRREYRPAIELMEGKLKELPSTDYHAILGQDLFQLTDSLAQWLDKFHRAACKAINVAALYCETNGFPINTDCWFIDAFAYQRRGDLDDDDWLSDWDFDLPDSSFIITGCEDWQKAFEKNYAAARKKDAQSHLKLAGALAEILFVLHVQDLFKRAHFRLAAMQSPCAKIPILATAHEWDLIAIAGKLN